MGFDQGVNQLDDRVDVKLAAGMRVHHRRLIIAVASARMGGFDRQQMDIDLHQIHRSALQRKTSDTAGMNAGVVDHAWDLDARFLREIGDQVSCVQDVPADLNGLVCQSGFHDVGGIFV